MKLLLLFTLSAVWSVGLVSCSSFDYHYQHAWGPSHIYGSVCTTGKEQSPINIRTDAVIKSSVMQTLRFGGWNIRRNGLLQNNGHTLNFESAVAGRAAFTITHNGKYQVMGVHMHWGENDGVGSEHRINGEQASLEIHFVHRNLATSNTARNAYAVVAIMAEAGSEVGNTHHSSPWKTLRVLSTPGSNTNAYLTYSDLLPKNDYSYY